ncbi:Yip1 family protein [Marinobacter sp. X15-166B]|uniref:Yip1 family protein n=1 Tax=Marinobacter sp. X15-166B TaxID=1897620 RepID=UPI00085CB459|nr:Yip1 family protein [Marinobacter sp. X15-166B]OEY66882.1 hypothetical protein BG841_10725 [Marinobacter sp. X15-166B]
MSLGHAFSLLVKPDRTWEAIRKDAEPVSKLYIGHILLLSLIPAAAGYYGSTHVGWQIGDGPVIRLTATSALQLTVLFYLALLVGIYIIGRFIDFFSATYAVKGRQRFGTTLAAYAVTPVLLLGASAAYPHIWLNMFVGFIAIAYAVYLLYEGLPILMNIPEGRGFMFASSVLTVGLVMFVALLAISVVIWSVGIGPVYTG